MADSLPDALRLRDIKYGEKSSPELRLRTAQALRAAGRMSEALDLFLLAADEDGIAGLHEHAVADGRPVLLNQLVRAGRDVATADWARAGAAAEAAGRWREAYRCFEAAGDEAALERLRERLPDYEVYVPEGK